MRMNRGQGDPVDLFIGLVIAGSIASVGIVLFDRLNQTLTITGPFAGTGEKVLLDAAAMFGLAIGGAGVVVTALLLLK